MSLPRIILAVALLVAAATPAAAQWRRVDTPNFVIVGAVGADRLRHVAVQFEGFRETMTRVLGARATRMAVPTVVVVFPSDRAFTPFKPRFEGKPIQLAGVFMGGDDANYIAIVEDGNPRRLTVVFHEYVHLLVSNSGLRVPPWLGEGLAEFYSTYELGRGGREAVIGGYDIDHLALLNDQPLMGLDQLLAVTHDSPLYNEGNRRRSVFYAQSWALTHLLMIDKPDRSAQLDAYMREVTAGRSSTEAWQRVFGAEDIFGVLSQYVRRQAFGQYVFTFSERVAKVDAQVVSLPTGQEEFFLADFLRRQRRFEDAANRLARATASDAAIMTAMIDADRGQGEALRRLREAARPDDWLTSYLAGVTAVDLIRRSATVDAVDLDRAAVFLEPRPGVAEFPNQAVQRATLELRGSREPTAAVVESLRQARAAVPGRWDFGLLLAEALARRGEFAEARNVLGPLMNPAQPQLVRDSARQLMGRVVDVERAVEARGAGAPPTAPPGSARATAPTSVTTSEPAMRPAFRDVKAGEERVEGVLESIGCTRYGLTFAVRVGKDLVSFSAADFSRVEFITYRNDLRGSVTCGPFPPPAPVYVTFRPSAGGETRGVVVAIEFLPTREPAPRSR